MRLDVDSTSTRTTQFSYFDHLLWNPVWKGRGILDFGGNCGGFLARAPDSIDPDDYCFVDVGRAARDEGSRRFPLARFVHFDCYTAIGRPGLAALLHSWKNLNPFTTS